MMDYSALSDDPWAAAGSPTAIDFTENTNKHPIQGLSRAVPEGVTVNQWQAFVNSAHQIPSSQSSSGEFSDPSSSMFSQPIPKSNTHKSKFSNLAECALSHCQKLESIYVWSLSETWQLLVMTSLFLVFVDGMYVACMRRMLQRPSSPFLMRLLKYQTLSWIALAILLVQYVLIPAFQCQASSWTAATNAFRFGLLVSLVHNMAVKHINPQWSLVQALQDSAWVAFMSFLVVLIISTMRKHVNYFHSSWSVFDNPVCSHHANKQK